ncbi:hypothetical protein A0H81_07893 [Grifola frondosa]|uniref:Uncharacterized protein n=1 Tax=Grifola frondosa TaxID=5627 RepID=A0A1C7M8A7_GRIFR|nr:hypothetical protein A0H81_07893 [Grifola frondosa]
MRKIVKVMDIQLEVVKKAYNDAHMNVVKGKKWAEAKVPALSIIYADLTTARKEFDYWLVTIYNEAHVATMLVEYLSWNNTTVIHLEAPEEKLVTDIAYMSKVPVEELKKQWQAGRYGAIIQDQLGTIKECPNKNINLLINLPCDLYGAPSASISFFRVHEQVTVPFLVKVMRGVHGMFFIHQVNVMLTRMDLVIHPLMLPSPEEQDSHLEKIDVLEVKGSE